jgi:hypothetical protein
MPSSEFDSVPEEVQDEDLDRYMKSMLAWGEKVNESAKGNILKAQNEQKKRYDAKRKPPRFLVGDEVWRYNGRKDTRKGGKLTWNWTGPYKICEVTTRGTYLLQNRKGVSLKQAVSSIHLKAVVDPSKKLVLQESDIYQYGSSDESSSAIDGQISPLSRKRKLARGKRNKRKRYRLSDFVLYNNTSSSMPHSPSPAAVLPFQLPVPSHHDDSTTTIASGISQCQNSTPVTSLASNKPQGIRMQ